MDKAENDNASILREELSHALKLNRELLAKNTELTLQVSYLQKELAKLKEVKLDDN